MRRGILIDEITGCLQVQIKRDSTGKIMSGLVVGDVDYQDIHRIITSGKGDFKDCPILAVGAEKYLKSVGKQEQLKREIALQLGNLGYKNPVIAITETGQLTIDI
jgi:hypothetical protein